MYIVRLDPAGNHLSSRLIRGISRIQAAVDGAGGVVVLGVLDGTVDLGGGPLPAGVTMMRLDAAGNLLWSRPAAAGASMRVGAAGEIFLSGTCHTSVSVAGVTIPCDASMFVAKLDAEGNYLWSRTFGDITGEPGLWNLTCAGDLDGNLIVGGSFSGSMDLGNGGVGSAGRSEGFLAKLAR